MIDNAANKFVVYVEKGQFSLHKMNQLETFDFYSELIKRHS